MLNTLLLKNKNLNPIVLLALVEFWERFNKYALRAFLVLYLIAPDISHHGTGLGWSIARSLNLYGLAIFSAYFFPIIGGIIGDRLTGSFYASFLGTILITAGQITISQAVDSSHSDILISSGLFIFAFGNGLFKPNTAKLVGEVSLHYQLNKQMSYSLFFIITNLGGIISGLSLGAIVMALDDDFSTAFLIAATGMCLGSLLLIFFRKSLNVSIPSSNKKAPSTIKQSTQDNKNTHYPITYILLIGCFTVFFWLGYQQMSGSFNIVLQKLTDRNIDGLEIPVAWFQSLTPLFNVTLTLFFRKYLVGKYTNTSSLPTRVLISIMIACVSFISLAFFLQSSIIQHSQINMLIMLFIYLGFSIGEVILSPACLSSISILIPSSKTSFILGFWFLFYGVSSYFSGLAGRLIDPERNTDMLNHQLTLNLIFTYKLLALIVLLSGLVLWLVRRKLVGLILQPKNSVER